MQESPQKEVFFVPNNARMMLVFRREMLGTFTAIYEVTIVSPKDSESEKTLSEIIPGEGDRRGTDPWFNHCVIRLLLCSTQKIIWRCGQALETLGERCGQNAFLLQEKQDEIQAVRDCIKRLNRLENALEKMLEAPSLVLEMILFSMKKLQN